MLAGPFCEQSSRRHLMSDDFEHDLADEEEIITCWCGAMGTFDELFAPEVYEENCGGSGVLHCFCAGDFCCCHHHGQLECPGWWQQQKSPAQKQCSTPLPPQFSSYTSGANSSSNVPMAPHQQVMISSSSARSCSKSSLMRCLLDDCSQNGPANINRNSLGDKLPGPRPVGGEAVIQRETLQGGGLLPLHHTDQALLLHRGVTAVAMTSGHGEASFSCQLHTLPLEGRVGVDDLAGVVPEIGRHGGRRFGSVAHPGLRVANQGGPLMATAEVGHGGTGLVRVLDADHRHHARSFGTRSHATLATDDRCPGTLRLLHPDLVASVPLRLAALVLGQLGQRSVRTWP